MTRLAIIVMAGRPARYRMRTRWISEVRTFAESFQGMFWTEWMIGGRNATGPGRCSG